MTNFLLTAREPFDIFLHGLKFHKSSEILSCYAASSPIIPPRSSVPQRTASASSQWRAGHAVAPVRAQGPQLRFGRHERPQRRLAALAAMARRREPLRHPVHELFGKRSPRRRLPSAGMVRAPREPAVGLLRRHLDALDVGSEGQGRRNDE
jgi:hypothetical protein